MRSAESLEIQLGPRPIPVGTYCDTYSEDANQVLYYWSMGGALGGLPGAAFRNMSRLWTGDALYLRIQTVLHRYFALHRGSGVSNPPQQHPRRCSSTLE